MAYQDRETHYVEKSTGNSAGWFMAGALVRCTDRWRPALRQWLFLRMTMS